ncbi:MAG: hypothetical protein ACD_70C00151G0001 [uncultured bacterium]|nr:MAG: hypothetical protein ACD_70C00151G0001 [uncultured bacterium]
MRRTGRSNIIIAVTIDAKLPDEIPNAGFVAISNVMAMGTASNNCISEVPMLFVTDTFNSRCIFACVASRNFLFSYTCPPYKRTTRYPSIPSLATCVTSPTDCCTLLLNKRMRTLLHFTTHASKGAITKNNNDNFQLTINITKISPIAIDDSRKQVSSASLDACATCSTLYTIVDNMCPELCRS